MSQLRQDAHRNADQQRAKLAAIPRGHPDFATVDGVTAGGAPDGRAAVTVTWRGSQNVPVAGYVASYTPVMGDRVAVMVVRDQPVILGGPIVGAP